MPRPSGAFSEWAMRLRELSVCSAPRLLNYWQFVDSQSHEGPQLTVAAVPAPVQVTSQLLLPHSTVAPSQFWQLVTRHGPSLQLSVIPAQAPLAGQSTRHRYVSGQLMVTSTQLSAWLHVMTQSTPAGQSIVSPLHSPVAHSTPHAV
jgi:hypothetical protein